MITPEQFREIALALPEASEQPHWDMPSFRVGKRIFATLQPDDGTAVLKIPVIEHDELIESS
ncbi:MAG TPA: MmcQ/YjbR family DNA-binding protein, partial [Thermoanaerobaculia bacterium]|nr:MmcQ/YjbR family DNA-binding protein [Thermoanaerobaculia bacterium]